MNLLLGTSIYSINALAYSHMNSVLVCTIYLPTAPPPPQKHKQNQTNGYIEYDYGINMKILCAYDGFPPRNCKSKRKIGRVEDQYNFSF